MRRNFVGICSVSLLLVVLLALLVPSCGGGTGKGTIVVQATLCGEPWQGGVSYTLTSGGGTSLITGTTAPTTHGSVDTGTWTCDYVSGDPFGADLQSITPSETQGLSAGGTITFTLNFGLQQDAAIKFLTWSVNGEPISLPPDQHIEVSVCDRVDVEFKQWVDGCEGGEVTMNETSELRITQIAGPAGVQIYVVNEPCGVITQPGAEKLSQVPSFNREPVDKYTFIDLPFDKPTILDIETVWNLANCLNYTKKIKWLGIAQAPFEPPPWHTCTLFELVLPKTGNYQFTVQASAEVELVDGGDTDLKNNSAQSAIVTLVITVF